MGVLHGYGNGQRGWHRLARHAAAAAGALLVVAGVSAGGGLARPAHGGTDRWQLGGARLPHRPGLALPAGMPQVPTPGSGGELRGVFCTSRSNCWAVGGYNMLSMTAVVNQTLHWNGKKWTLAHPPNPAGTSSGDANFLGGVRCTSARNCLAVGTYGTRAIPLSC
ncbi:MAG TPA: hypothetical protein VH641_02990 [Streptosporangiaceae bacterium]|jgi:hypothetical protein